MRTAIVVFTKVPKVGTAKTRLTTGRGGILTPEEAKELYEAFLLDVIDSCIASASSEIYICHDAEGDSAHLKHLLEGVSSADCIKEIFPDKGETFDKGMQYASDYLLKGSGGERLADAILIVGGDVPSLQPATIREAFRKLETMACQNGEGKRRPEIGPAMVVSADQECGFNLIGYTFSTPFEFADVFYNQNGVTALDMISLKATAQQIPFGILEIVPDVDVPVDFAGFISVLRTMRIAEKYDKNISLPMRTIQNLEALGLESSAPVPHDYLH